MTEQIKLYDYYRSSAAYRVRIALNYKKLNYQHIPVHLGKDGGEQHKPDYQKINPQQLVPSLQIDYLTLTQSLAIIEFLDEVYPMPALLSVDICKKAYIRSLALTIACDMHPLNNLRVLNYLQDELKVDEQQKMQWYHHWLALGFDALEKRIAPNYQGKGYCVADHFTLADVCLIPQIYNAHRFNFAMSNYPILSEIYDHCVALDFVDAVTPERVQELI